MEIGHFRLFLIHWFTNGLCEGVKLNRPFGIEINLLCNAHFLGVLVGFSLLIDEYMNKYEGYRKKTTFFALLGGLLRERVRLDIHHLFNICSLGRMK